MTEPSISFGPVLSQRLGRSLGINHAPLKASIIAVHLVRQEAGVMLYSRGEGDWSIVRWIS